ncbi:recombinase family protein [Streptomyces xanthochromogenes]|uniref:recombinase family protein n=1 Tax=Streptomyces xanthochromogenes TaxID=67384 RepID=UPI003824BBEA
MKYKAPSRAHLLRYVDEIENPTRLDVPGTFRGAVDLDTLEPFVGYIRVSSWNEEKISPELQKTAIRDWARRNGKRIIGWISDLDATGRNFRRKIMKGIEAVEGRIAAGIAVWRYSRFGRNRTGNAINLARLEDIGGRLESATEPVDAGTAIGRFQRGMILEFSAFESDRAGEQWTEVHAHRLGLGLPSAGRPRFGYLWTPRRVPDPTAPAGWRLQEEKYTADPNAAPLLPELYLAYIDGTGFIELARMVNEQGHLTGRRNPWRADSLLRYMDSGFPAGLLRVRDSCDCPKKDKQGSKCQHWRYFRGAHDPIINHEIDRDADELWEEYRERRRAVAKTPPRSRVAAWDLTGLVRCALCGGSMTGHESSGGGVYWRCARADAGGACTGSKGTYGDLLKEVDEFLAKIAGDIDVLPAATDVSVPPPAEGPDPAVERARLTKEHAQWQAALTRLVTDYAVHPERYPEEAYDAARKNIEAERDKVLAQLSDIEEEREEDEVPTQQDFKPLVVGVLPEWPTYTALSRNLILRKVLRYVVVWPRPSRYETRCRAVPIWAPEEEAPHAWTAPAPSDGLEDMPDGIAWSIA